jgi:heme/copper-type cytochrome/quinol oxidase subunit 3
MTGLGMTGLGMTGLGMTGVERWRALNRRENGLPLVLAIDGLVFACLLTAYFTARAHTAVWPRPFHFPSGLMTISMMMFALAASFVMHVALKSAEKRDYVMAQRMIALALVGWSTFLFLLAMEWGRLYFVEHVAPLSNPWSVPALGVVYYGITTYQAAHVGVGSVWLLMAAQKPSQWHLSSLALFVDFTNALFVVIGFLGSTDLGGF